ncbi:calcium binding protein [Anaeramoeba ignava]|uniref:Calcium binding protein n=1 Tax=Anaeramoeba ignava TaxID=1746090 RepID=A0A9Q0RFE7_ANAIG|nr:calcium binding protein [Anaeramoeba ignava]
MQKLTEEQETKFLHFLKVNCEFEEPKTKFYSSKDIETIFSLSETSSLIIFDYIDKQKERTITFNQIAEFLAIFTNGEPSLKGKELFHLWDQNKDGFIDRKEAYQFIDCVLQISVSQLKQVIEGITSSQSAMTSFLEGFEMGMQMTSEYQNQNKNQINSKQNQPKLNEEDAKQILEQSMTTLNLQNPETINGVVDEMFKQTDIDKDGLISEKEFVHHFLNEYHSPLHQFLEHITFIFKDENEMLNFHQQMTELMKIPTKNVEQKQNPKTVEAFNPFDFIEMENFKKKQNENQEIQNENQEIQNENQENQNQNQNQNQENQNQNQAFDPFQQDFLDSKFYFQAFQEYSNEIQFPIGNFPEFDGNAKENEEMLADLKEKIKEFDPIIGPVFYQYQTVIYFLIFLLEMGMLSINGWEKVFEEGDQSIRGFRYKKGDKRIMVYLKDIENGSQSILAAFVPDPKKLPSLDKEVPIQQNIQNQDNSEKSQQNSNTGECLLM